MPTAVHVRTAALVLAAVVTLGGCTGSADESPSSSPTPSGVAASMRPADVPLCLPKGSAAVTVGPEDDPTLVGFTGSGTKGVVLAPQSDGQVCQWARQLERLAGEGYLVATFSWSADGERSFTDAVDVLHTLGATDVAFVGASKGGMYAAALADDLDPVTVVALGPPAEYEGHDARSTSSRYTGPLLVVASTDDRNVAAMSSKLVSRADDPSTFVELTGSAHGVALFAGEHRAQVEQAIDDALAWRSAARKPEGVRPRGGVARLRRAACRSDEAAPRERREADARGEQDDRRDEPSQRADPGAVGPGDVDRVRRRADRTRGCAVRHALGRRPLGARAEHRVLHAEVLGRLLAADHDLRRALVRQLLRAVDELRRTVGRRVEPVRELRGPVGCVGQAVGERPRARGRLGDAGGEVTGTVALPARLAPAPSWAKPGGERVATARSAARPGLQRVDATAEGPWASNRVVDPGRPRRR